LTKNRQLSVEIWRGQADGRYQTYRVPLLESQTILDVVSYIQRRIDPTLCYRFACRVGMCGSCAMMVNGKPRWTCRSHVSRVAVDGRLKLGPLRNLPVIRDLVTDMSGFFDKWQAAGGRFRPPEPPAQNMARVSPREPQRAAADAGIECIGCAACYAACDVVAWNPEYLGPAALNRAWTLVNDRRDADRKGHLAAVASDAGCHQCHSHQACSRHCPKELNPGKSIAGLKRAVFGAAIKGDL